MTRTENAQRPSSLASIVFKRGHNLATNKAPVMSEEPDRCVRTHVCIGTALSPSGPYQMAL